MAVPQNGCWRSEGLERLSDGAHCPKVRPQVKENGIPVSGMACNLVRERIIAPAVFLLRLELALRLVSLMKLTRELEPRSPRMPTRLFVEPKCCSVFHPPPRIWSRGYPRIRSSSAICSRACKHRDPPDFGQSHAGATPFLQQHTRPGLVGSSRRHGPRDG